jgi:hypothetical protein
VISVIRRKVHRISSMRDKDDIQPDRESNFPSTCHSFKYESASTEMLTLRRDCGGHWDEISRCLWCHLSFGLFINPSVLPYIIAGRDGFPQNIIRRNCRFHRTPSSFPFAILFWSPRLRFPVSDSILGKNRFKTRPNKCPSIILRNFVRRRNAKLS